jgi:hypothetical protein
VRRLVLAIAAAGALAGATPALAQSPTLTVAQIPCETIDYDGATAHSTAVLSCVDEQDGIELRLHDDGISRWLEVAP